MSRRNVWAQIADWFKRLLGPAQPEPQTTSQGDDEDEPVARGLGLARLSADELASVRKDLRYVLDQHPESRKVMRYLRALEHGLHKKGRHALEELPAEILRRGLEQLDMLVTDRSLPGLSTLRSKSAVSIAQRQLVIAARDRPRPVEKTDDNEVEVEETSHTVFLEVSDQWERSFTGEDRAERVDESVKTPPSASVGSP